MAKWFIAFLFAPPKGCFVTIEDMKSGKSPRNRSDIARDTYSRCNFGSPTDSLAVAEPLLRIVELGKRERG